MIKKLKDITSILKTLKKGEPLTKEYVNENSYKTYIVYIDLRGHSIRQYIPKKIFKELTKKKLICLSDTLFELDSSWPEKKILYYITKKGKKLFRKKQTINYVVPTTSCTYTCTINGTYTLSDTNTIISTTSPISIDTISESYNHTEPYDITSSLCY